MEFIPFDQCMKCDMVYHVGTTFATNTIYLRANVPVTTEICNDVANMMTDWWNDAIKAQQPQTVYFDHVEVRDLTVRDSWYASATITPNQGTAIGDILPMNATIATKFYTNKAGRSYRGRNYWVGLMRADVTGDFVSQARRDGIAAAYDNLSTKLAELGLSWVICSRQNNKVKRAIGVYTYVQGHSTESTVDSQRRRLSGRGT